MDEQQFQKEVSELGTKMVLETARGVAGSEKTSAEDWSKVFKDITPKQLYSRYKKAAGDAPVFFEITFSSNANSPTYFNIFHKYKNKHSDNDRIEIVIDHDSFAHLEGINFSEQGKGVAKRYLSESVDMLRDIGIESLGLNAVHTGSYVWAKYGFTPQDDLAWDKLKIAIRDSFDSDGKLLFKDNAYDVSLEKSVIDKILHTDFVDLPDAFPQLTELNRVIGEYRGHELTVGKALLMSKDWLGKLPFVDGHPSFERFKNYTGNNRDLKAETAL